jgi:twitching motility protein PilT
MFANQAVRNLVREGKTAQIRNAIISSQRDGAQTLEMDLTRLVAEGIVSHEEAAAHAIVPKDVKPALSVAPLRAAADPVSRVGTYVGPGESSIGRHSRHS